jgi:PhnB protein
MSSIQLDAYLFFKGNCREAMEFYKDVFGGKLTVQTYGEVPGEKPAAMKGMDDKVMHALLTGGVIRLMASDSTRKKAFGESFISLSLSDSDEKKLRTIFSKLAKGGKVTQPLEKQFWGDVFGGLTDKFGVDWMVNINAETSKK